MYYLLSYHLKQVSKENNIKPIMYLDNANLLEVVSNFLNCGIFSKSLNKNGVVVRVVLLSTCEWKGKNTSAMTKNRDKSHQTTNSGKV